MRVNVNGQEYVMSFRHMNAGQGQLNLTLCFVDKKDEVQPAGFRLVHGVARCVPEDQYVKEKGRKIALGRALLFLFPEDKATRTRFWEAYHGRSKGQMGV